MAAGDVLGALRGYASRCTLMRHRSRSSAAHCAPRLAYRDRDKACLVGELELEKLMIRSIAVAAFVLVVATSAEAMPPVPIHQPDGMTTQVAYGCGLGRTRVAGVCVARTTKRHVRRQVRRAYRRY
jgi:hypothetical protein